MKKIKLFSILALLLMAATGAVAQTETLLTTITATGKEQANYSTEGVATVSFSYTAYGSSAYLANWGWWGYGWSATVNAAEGYTITKCVFYDDQDRTATDSEAPFVVETTEEDKTPQVNGTPILAYTSKGIKKIEVYGYVTPTTVDVTLADGTDDATSWQGKAGEGEYQALPLTGLEAATAVSVKYNGTKKVKSVKAKKKAAAEPAGPTAYTLAESTQGMIVGTDGKAYDVADKDNLPTGVTAAGVVVYKNGSNGLAIALTDEASTMYWSTANGETGAAAHTPTVTGYSWRLPSMDEWKQMFGANGGNNESYTGLNTAINTAGGTALLVENGIYWTCTETAYSGHYIAFLNANVSFFMDDDNNANRIRACIAF